MNPQPGTSRESISSHDRGSDFLSPKKKRSRSALIKNEKLMVINIYKYNVQNWPTGTEWSATECAKKTAEMAGVALSTVYKITNEYKDTKDLESPKKTGPQLSFKNKFDEFTFSAIRRKVHNFFYQKEAPTIEKVRIFLLLHT
jgi:hypothetical protein